MSLYYHPGVYIADVLHAPPDLFTRIVSTLRVGSAEHPGIPLAQARVLLEWELTAGNRLLPLGPCDRWNGQTGCQGHVEEDAA